MIVNRCRSPVRDFLGSSKHPRRRTSAATPPFLGSHTNVKRAGDVSKWITARRRSAQSAAEMSARSHANGAAPQCHLHVISILNAAAANGGHWIQALRADESLRLLVRPARMSDSRA